LLVVECEWGECATAHDREVEFAAQAGPTQGVAQSFHFTGRMSGVQFDDVQVEERLQ